MSALRVGFSSFDVQQLQETKLSRVVVFVCDLSFRWKSWNDVIPSLNKRKFRIWINGRLCWELFWFIRGRKVRRRLRRCSWSNWCLPRRTSGKCRGCSRKLRQRGERCWWFNCWNISSKIWTEISSEWMVSQAYYEKRYYQKAEQVHKKPFVRDTLKMSLDLP